MPTVLKRILIFIGTLTLCFSANMGFETHRDNPVGWALFVVGILGTAAGVIVLGKPMIHQNLRRDISLWLLLPGVMCVGLGAPLEFRLLPSLLPRLELIPMIGILISTAGALLIIFSGQFLHLFRDPIRSRAGSPNDLPSKPKLFSSGIWLVLLGIAVGYSSLIGLAGCFLFLLPGAILRQKLTPSL